MNFNQKVNLSIENKKYLIKTLKDQNELEMVLKLRHKIFYEELLNRKLKDEKDMDRFDELCDHLVVLDKENDLIVGTYRIMCSRFSNDFYSETEFNIKDIKNLSGIKLELGRACIQKQRRSGVILMMLWKGIMEYSKRVNSSYLFGCSSVKTMDLLEVAKISNTLRRRGFVLNTNVHITPKKEFEIENFEKYQKKVGDELPKTKIPSLLESYLKAGVKVIDKPALDKNFKCVDFFTLLDFKEISGNILRKIK